MEKKEYTSSEEMMEFFKKGTMPNACYGPVVEEKYLEYDNTTENESVKNKKKQPSNSQWDNPCSIFKMVCSYYKEPHNGNEETLFSGYGDGRRQS